jgi:hypothetical protein
MVQLEEPEQATTSLMLDEIKAPWSDDNTLEPEVIARYALTTRADNFKILLSLCDFPTLDWLLFYIL